MVKRIVAAVLALSVVAIVAMTPNAHAKQPICQPGDDNRHCRPV